MLHMLWMERNSFAVEHSAPLDLILVPGPHSDPRRSATACRPPARTIHPVLLPSIPHHNGCQPTPPARARHAPSLHAAAAGETTIERVERWCGRAITDARVYALAYTSSGERFLFWMQVPSSRSY